MAAVAEQRPDPFAQFGPRVDEQIAQATNRIRAHDLTLGVLTLAAMVAMYATMMILLDKYLNLAEWIRQLALAGFGVLCAAVGYLLIARPLLKRINPLYAAARVEETIDDAKNSVTGYVEAQENDNVHAAVKAAMSARAARAVDEADVNEAIDNRGLIVAGGVLVAFLLTLGVLFFVFRPTQFNSLAGRTFFPFASAPIATRTQLTLLKPENPQPTITTGQTITVAVHVGGKIPAKDAPDRVRVLLRHNPLDPNFEVVPMAQGETTRDWEVKVPEYLVQHGFWYKVAAGDAETPEYKVTVRSLPLFTDFVANYEYPAYTQKPKDKANDPNLSGLRGTKVTLLARTNRQVRAGLMRFDAPGLPPVAGKPAPDKPDSLAFHFTITEPTRYRLSMTTTDDEQSADAPAFLVSVDSDQPPRLEVTRPEDEEKPEPANGQLAVDGTVGDDYGIDKVRLRMRIAGRDLKPVFYNGGKSLRREDNTWPTDLSQFGGFKLSADLTKLEYADGAACQPKETDVIEYWVEAIDNCTETKPVEGWGEKPQPGNVGSSKPVRKLKLTAPRTADAEKMQLDQQKQARHTEEQQHNAAQQEELKNEQRDAPKPEAGRQPQREKPQDKDGDGKPEPKPGDPKTGDAQPKDGKDGTDGKGDKPDAKENKSAKDGKGTNPGPHPQQGKKDNKPDSGATGPKENKQPGGSSAPKTGDTKGKGDAAGMQDPGMSDPMTPPPPGGKQAEPKSGKGKSSGMPEKGGMTEPGMGGTGSGMNTEPQTAPPPRSQDEATLDEQLRQAEEELNKLRGEGGDAKPNRTPKPEDRTDPAKSKTQPMQPGAQDSQPKEGPKPDPNTQPGGGNNAAAESKPQGDLKPSPSPDPESKPGSPGEMQANEKPEPLGGSAGRDQPAPKSDGKKDTKPAGLQDKKQDPASGAEARPATQQPDDGKPEDPAAKAGSVKPNPDNDRGNDRTPPKGMPAGMPPPDNQPKADPDAGAAKPDGAPPEAGAKPMPKKDGANGKQPDASETKEAPKDRMDPKNPAGAPAATKPQPKTPMGGGMGDDKAVEPGIDKAQQPDQARGGDSTKNDAKEPGKGDNANAAKLDPKQLQELKDAAKDLSSADEGKRKAAQEKLDKAIGKPGREAIEDFQNKQKEDLEKLAKDLDSKDQATREAAQKKLKELEDAIRKTGDELTQKKTGGKGGKGEERKLSEAELAELVKKAQDLTSDNKEAREAAERDLDQQLSKEARERIQKELEKRKKEGDDFLKDPKQRDELRKKLEQARKDRRDSKGDSDQLSNTGGGADTSKPPSAMETDPRNRARATQLQLEDFKREQFGTVPERLKWTPEQYKQFLDDLEKRARRLEKEADAHEAAERDKLGKPSIAVGGADKVDERGNVVAPGGLKGGAGIAPPGFSAPAERFRIEAKKINQDK